MDDESDEELQTTAQVVRQFSGFCKDLRKQSLAGTPGFEPDNIAVMMGQQAQLLAEDFLHESAFGLLMHAAKMTLGFTIAAEQGELTKSEARKNIGLALAETIKHLDE